MDKKKETKQSSNIEDALLKKAEEFVNAEPGNIKYPGRKKEQFKIINTQKKR